MWIAVAAIASVVVILALKSESMASGAKSLPPNDAIPYLGNAASPSPATSAGSFTASRLYQTQNGMISGTVRTLNGRPVPLPPLSVKLDEMYETKELVTSQQIRPLPTTQLRPGTNTIKI